MMKQSLQESLCFGIFLLSIRALPDLDGYSLSGKRERSCQDPFIMYLFAMNMIQRLPFEFDERIFGGF